MKLNVLRTSTCALLGVSVVWAASSTAYAQDAADSGAAALEEIIVTAERRVQDIQKTATSITAISGDELLQQGKDTLQEILQGVPGVTAYAPLGGGSTNSPNVVPSDNPAVNYIIRGVPVGQQPTLGSAATTTAYYADEIYGGLGGDYDINRVEVLRGPQGTLYGRSATSGLVAVHTRDPELFDFHGDGSLEVASFRLRNASAAVNLPLGDTFAVRIAGKHMQQNGQIDAEGTRQKSQAVRAKMLWEPSEDFSLLLGYAYQHDDSNSGGATQETAPDQPDTIITTNYDAPIFANYTQQRQMWAQVNFNAGIGDLTYIPAYRTYETQGAVSAFNGFIRQDQVISPDTFTTHEIRLSSREDSLVQWVAGATYYRNALKMVQAPVWVSSEAPVSLNITDKKARAMGVFAEATLPFADTWRATAGARYDKTRVQVSQITATNTNNTILCGPTTPVPVCFTLPGTGLPVAMIYGSLSGEDGKRNFSNLTYKLRIEKELTPDSLLYAMVSTGFLPGDVSLTTFGGNQIRINTLDQQELVSFEVGSKNRFLNDTLQVNAGLFYYDYEGFQQEVNTNPNSQDSYIILSSPARMWGAEFEMSYLFTQNDRVDLNLGYTNARFVDKPDTSENPFATWIAQEKIPKVIPYSAALAYDHTFHAPGGSTIDLYNQVRVTGGHDESAINTQWQWPVSQPYIHTGAQTIDDASLGWSSPEQRYNVSFYVHNVFDKVYKQNATVMGSASTTQPAGLTTNYPRTFGAVFMATF